MFNYRDINMYLYQSVKDIDTARYLKTSNDTVFFNDWTYTDKYLESLSKLKTEIAREEKAFQDSISSCFNFSFVSMYLYPDENYLPVQDTVSYEWKYEKEAKTFDQLPNILPVTDENICLVGEIACKVALRTMEERSKGHKKAYTKKDGSESEYSYTGTSNYAHEIRKQAIRSYKEREALAYAESIDNGKMQERKVQKKQLVKTAKNRHHKTEINAAILKDYGYSASDIKDLLAHNYNTMWIPCRIESMEETEEGSEYNKVLATISTCNDFDDCKQESILAICEYIAENPDCDNLWNVFWTACKAVHKYVNGMKSYQDKVYKKPHSESDSRQDESGNEIFEWEKTSEFSRIDESESNNDFLNYIDIVLESVKDKQKREAMRKYLLLSDIGYNQKQIAKILNISDRTIRNYAVTLQEIMDKKILQWIICGNTSERDTVFLMGNKTSTR